MHRLLFAVRRFSQILPVICLWKTILIERAKGNDPIADMLRSKSPSGACNIM